MPLQEAVPAPPITDLPAPAGGFEFDVAAVDPDVFRVTLTGAVTTGAGKGTYVNDHPYPVLLREVRLHAETAPGAGGLIVDVNVEGTSAFSVQATRPSLAQGQTDSTATPARAGDRVLAQPGQTVTVDVDTAGGSDVTVSVELVEIAEGNREGELY